MPTTNVSLHPYLRMGDAGTLDMAGTRKPFWIREQSLRNTREDRGSGIPLAPKWSLRELVQSSL